VLCVGKVHSVLRNHLDVTSEQISKRTQKKWKKQLFTSRPQLDHRLESFSGSSLGRVCVWTDDKRYTCRQITKKITLQPPLALFSCTDPPGGIFCRHVFPCKSTDAHLPLVPSSPLLIPLLVAHLPCWPKTKARKKRLTVLCCHSRGCTCDQARCAERTDVL
ncbi:unnamed protein product, partial [Discosporangium mesarthrocarpum]